MSDRITHEFVLGTSLKDKCDFMWGYGGMCSQPRSAHAKLSDQHSHLKSDNTAPIAEIRERHGPLNRRAMP